ncbi:MAG: HEXXH motif domain-containing protein [Streptosporangiaceae bacterium]
MNIGYHRLAPELFGAMAAGGGGSAAVEILKRAQHSKHTLLLLGVVTSAETSGHKQRALARRGYDLLASVQGCDPSAVTSVIRHPSVGAWAHRTMIALCGGPGMPGATPGGLAAVAAAATITAGVPAEIEVPVNDGIVMLPSVGAAGPIDAETATVRNSDGRTEVAAAGQRVIIPGNRRDRAVGWHPVRTIEVGPFELLIDDLDPFRMPAAVGLATRVDLHRWSPVFHRAWTLLEQHHPAVAEEVAGLIRVIVPLITPPRGLVSSSSPETFGAIALSEPPDAVTLACTLTHEVQHIKLSALLDLVRLTRPDDGRRFYAPWREDPRPISGLLQGAYAYLGVSGFWRRQRELDHSLDAYVEFARWREAAALVTDVLQSSGQLTAAGEAFVQDMGSTLDTWQIEHVPEVARRRASEDGERHRTRWQAQYGPIAVALGAGRKLNLWRVEVPVEAATFSSGHGVGMIIAEGLSVAWQRVGG